MKNILDCQKGKVFYTTLNWVTACPVKFIFIRAVWARENLLSFEYEHIICDLIMFGGNKISDICQ